MASRLSFSGSFSVSHTGIFVDGSRCGGPFHRELGIPLDMAIQLRTESGILASTSLSFNHEGEPGSVFRYICDEGTLVVGNDEITGTDGIPVPVLIEGFVSGLHAMDQNFVQLD